MALVSQFATNLIIIDLPRWLLFYVRQGRFELLVAESGVVQGFSTLLISLSAPVDTRKSLWVLTGRKCRCFFHPGLCIWIDCMWKCLASFFPNPWPHRPFHSRTQISNVYPIKVVSFMNGRRDMMIRCLCYVKVKQFTDGHFELFIWLFC